MGNKVVALGGSSESAPKEWQELDGVIKFKPNKHFGSVSLQRYYGTNVCQWHYQEGLLWQPHGPMLFIKE